MYLDDIDSLDIGNSTLSYFHENNTFRDAYMPKSTNGFVMQAQRFVTVKNWKVYGNFQFSRFEDFESRYTAMANPYSNNPYKVADSIQADWRKQYYLLEAKVVSPQINRYIKAGIGIKYEILNGARQRDPRPLDKTLNIELTPSLIFDVGPKWDIGINGYYNHIRQDLNISLENTLRPQEIYKMLGLNAYLFNGPILLGGTLSRVYEGDRVGGGLSLGFTMNPRHKIKSIFTYKQHNEEAIDGTSTPFKAGDYQYNELETRISYSAIGGKYQHSLMFHAQYRDISGTEHVQVLNTDTQQYEVLVSSEMYGMTTTKLGTDYEMLVTDEHQNIKWLYRLGFLFNNLEEEYPSTQNERSYANLLGHLGATRWVQLKKGILSFSYSVKYQTNLQEDLVYIENPNSTNFIALQIANPNHVFDTTNYLNNQFDVQYTFKPFSKRSAQMYIKAEYQNHRSIQENLLYTNGLDNNLFMFTIGIYN